MSPMSGWKVFAGVVGLASSVSAQSSWPAQWYTVNCTGGSVDASCAELTNLSYVPPAPGESLGYVWAPPNSCGSTGAQCFCLPNGVSVNGHGVRGCGTAVFRLFCTRPTRIQILADGQAAVAAGNDDSYWAYLDTDVGSANLVTGWGLAPNWNFRALLGAPVLMSPGPHTITLAEREDSTRVRFLEISQGYPDCQFGAPPVTPNITAESVRLEVLQLETDTNNRISALSSTIDAINSTIASAIAAYNITLQSQLGDVEAEHEAQHDAMVSAVSTATASIAAVTSRLSGVGSYSGGPGVTLPRTPAVQTSGTSAQDIALNAGLGGTVRVSGATCQADLCELVGQVSQLTDALRQL